jgi:cell division septum initiation protein DivIVA
MARGSRAAERSSKKYDEDKCMDPGDRSQLPAGGLRALLKEAAQVRKSTLSYFEANPNECSPEARRRASQAPASSRPSEAVPLLLGGRNPDEPPPGEDQEASQATPVDVVPTGSGGHTLSPQTSERGGAAELQGSDAELRKQLRESQAEVRRLQGALDAEHDTTRRLAAELRNAEEACDSLRSKLSDLDTQLAQAKEALELQESAVADAEAFAEELEEMQELLADSERQNNDLQKRLNVVDDPEGFAAELEEMQELLADSERQNKELQKKLKAVPDAAAIAKELEEMREKLAASERENTEVLKKLSAVSDADSFAEELEEMREKLAASERENTELQGEADALQREYDAMIEQLRGELAASEAAREKVQTDCDKALSGLRDKLEHSKGKPEDPEEVVSRELTPVDRARARKKERENAAALEKELQDLRAQVSELAEANERLRTASAVAASKAADLETDADPPSSSRAIKAPVAADSVLVDAEILASMCTRAGSGASPCKLFLDGWRIVMAREEALRRDATMAALLESRGRRMCVAASLRRWVSAVSHAVRNNPPDATVRRSMSHEPRREAGTAGDRDIQDGDCGSDGGVGEGAGGYVSEGVQTMSVEERTQGAQTVPAAGSGIHTQTAPPEPGVVVETQTTTATNASTTQTTAAATATTATGTGDEDGGMDVQVASGPAPAPRELAMALSDDASSATTSLDAAGPGSEHYDGGCGTSDSIDLRELEEHLREGCELVEGLEWNEWLLTLERGGKETVAAAAAARQLEQTLPLLLRSVGLLTRESGEMASSSSAQSDSSRDARRELEEARAMVAAAVADRDRAQRRQEEMDDGIGASVSEMEKQLLEAEKQLEELEEEVAVCLWACVCVCVHAQALCCARACART